ncbi:MAG: hypothetical protein KDD56_05435 [Bdellovibrionales bacterium]|nr:hypothetical protein [Bdellovibrionales bacterium]
MDIKGIKMLVQEPEIRTKRVEGDKNKLETKPTKNLSSEIDEREFAEITNLALGLAQRIGEDAETSLAAIGELSSAKVFSLTEQGIAV